ncbi:MAG: hypothetical protein E6835_08120 [Lactococcus lactis]|jgi:hypothetical protein|nr:hypothetical protein [Lactococcus lactis]DAG13946.1 MAG TPA: hypothetical protein [Caudoviricetes sp.]
MGYIQYVKWYDESVTEYKYSNHSEEEGYIEFKKEPKKYKIFVKLVTIGEENKKLYYVNEHHLTDNIDEAKRFGLNEDKYGYAYEYVKEY